MGRNPSHEIAKRSVTIRDGSLETRNIIRDYFTNGYEGFILADKLKGNRKVFISGKSFNDEEKCDTVGEWLLRTERIEHTSKEDYL